MISKSVLITILTIVIIQGSTFGTSGEFGRLIYDQKSGQDIYGFSDSKFSFIREGRMFGIKLRTPSPSNIYSSLTAFFVLTAENAKIKYLDHYVIDRPQRPDAPLDNGNWEFATSLKENDFQNVDDEISLTGENTYQVLLSTHFDVDTLFFKITEYTHPAYLTFIFFETDFQGNPSTQLTITHRSLGSFGSNDKIPITQPDGLGQYQAFQNPPANPVQPLLLPISIGVGTGLAVAVPSHLLFRKKSAKPVVSKIQENNLIALANQVN